VANLLWCAREAAAKVRREGLRLDVRHAGVVLDGVAAARSGGAGRSGGWRPLQVVWPDAEPTSGWWRADPGWVMVVAGAPAFRAPGRLEP
jgi:hypothetical protein